MHRLDDNEHFLPTRTSQFGFMALAGGAVGLFIASITLAIPAIYRLGGVLVSCAIATVLIGYIAIKLKQAFNTKQMCDMVTDAVAESIMVLNLQGKIMAANGSAARLLGRPGASLLGKSFGTLTSTAGRAEIERFLNDMADPDTIANALFNTQIEILRPDGTFMPICFNLCDVTEIEDCVVCSFHDISRQVLAEAELKQSKAEIEYNLVAMQQKERVIQLSLQGAGAGYWHQNYETGTLTLDDAAIKMLGIDQATFGGRYADWADKIHPEDFPWTQGALMDAMDGQADNFVWDYRVIVKGETRYLHVTANIERDQNNTPLAAYGLNFDLTEEKTAALALSQARDEAELANKAKSAFLAAMSHEIRTPMNGVVGMIDVLNHTPLNSEQEDLTQTIRDSAFSLLSIIDDILDFSKIEAGRLDVEQVPVELYKVLQGVGDTLYSLAEKKNIQLFTYCDPGLPTIYGDPVRLRQILFNLGGNAIKFTGNDPAVTGRVLIRIEAMPPVVEGRIRIAMHIEDNGIGISLEGQAKLFKPFSQAESSTTRKFGGTGLGLTICLRLAELMGGKIDIQSTEGQGSTFTALLDLEAVPDAQSLIKHDLSGLSIPLMCFDSRVAGFLQSYLSHAGARVYPVADSEALTFRCLGLANNQSEQVIIIDSMGDRRITDMLRDSLQEDLPNQSLKFVVLERGKRRHPRSQGDNEIAIDLDVLHRDAFLLTVAAIAGRCSIAPPACLTAERKKDRRVIPTVDEAVAARQLILVAEDNPTNQKVLLHQLALLGYAAEVADDGKVALEQWRSGRYSLLLTDCHMPELDGYELAHAIRIEEAAATHLPIIAITADALKGTDKLCADAGMDDYLTKPIQLELLRAKVVKWMPEPVRGGLLDELGEDAPDMADDTPIPAAPHTVSAIEATANKAFEIADAPTVVNVQSLIEVLGMDDFAMLADFYLDFLNIGEANAIELQQAYQEQHHDAVGKLAHRLKSSARTVGAHALADCCMSLEQAGRERDTETIDALMQGFPALFHEVKAWILHYTESATA